MKPDTLLPDPAVFSSPGERLAHSPEEVSRQGSSLPPTGTQATAPKLDDLLNDLYRWLVRALGQKAARRLMLGALLLVAATSLGFNNRDFVITLPGVSTVVTTIREPRLPVLNANDRAVLVADLDGDPNKEVRDSYISWLRQHGIRSVPLGRAIHVPITMTDEEKKANTLAAIRFLKQTNAKLIIWGRMHHVGNRLVPELYFVMVGSTESAAAYDLKDWDSDGMQVISPRLRQQIARALKLILDAELAQLARQEQAIQQFSGRLAEMAPGPAVTSSLPIGTATR
ncbi:hypothetical protein AWB70_04323 [Caballeronia cordobensis]|uniref:Uncharacterized protein n=1 Tax=Caballeronia cordobensis TaxID=1353886 RepID=A0A158I7C7_CABCO|nr:hypothetical protein [Caballeronia cordobensis]SAL52273.1 hypothetical protein AWB70_04323 [Caballeronia cordobensis]